ncbi:hypothetical protein TAMA11512_17590 [Selenomonas sp. TAMA-11512]|uniref:nucleotide-binding domain containing protein n=1 Tax=Selenomonas sp. TAMA-11512 TaxID=3095337 RepID=UPI00308B3A0C|nr:hypothetical protein TAMA11512_17590 [Selenomonas sp. TAMA-11512]
MDEVAKACVALDWNVLAADPGPFTTKLAYRRGLVEPEAPNIPDGPPVRNKTVLIAAGSATPVTKKQMEVLTQDERCIRISCDPRAFIEDGETALHEVDRAVDAAIVLLNRREQPRAILFETALHDIVLNLAEEDAAHGYTEGNSSADRINAGLGMIISRVLRRVDRDKIAGIYATGGDTMVNVCAMLGVESIEVLDYVIAQIDVGRLTGHYEGFPIIGKGGLTGHNGMAIEIVDRIMLEASR